MEYYIDPFLNLVLTNAFVSLYTNVYKRFSNMTLATREQATNDWALKHCLILLMFSE